VPRGRVIKDDAIYEIAQQQPTTAPALAQLRTIPRGFERSRSAEEILAAVKKAVGLPKEQLPRLPKHRPTTNGNGAAVDLLKVLLKMISENHGVAAKVIATVDDLEALAADDTADVPALHGWRRELFGETALKLKRGNIALAVRANQVVAIEE
jgi:ribonuclease D